MLLVLVLVACVVGLLALMTRTRATVEHEAAALLVEQRLVDQIDREIARQLLDAAQYLSDPRPATLDAFHAHGASVYDGLRRYLFRDLSLDQRLQVERIKELHAELEVSASDAFELRRRGELAAAQARGAAVILEAAPLQAALDRFLEMRAAEYEQLLARESMLLRRVYTGAAILTLLLLVGVALALRVVRRRLVVPLAELSRVAARLGNGDLQARVQVRGDDELSQLAASFNAMAGGLEALGVELRRSEDRYRSLVELSPDSVLVQREGRIVLANDAAGRRFGASGAASLLGRPLLDLILPDARARAESHLAAATTAGEGAEPLELPFVGADDAPAWGELAAAPFEYDGAPATLVVVRDATARKKAEAALHDAETRLRQAQKMEAVGRLAGGIAHDFNNLLTVIGSYGRLLLDTMEPGDPRRADVSEIDAAARRAAALTGQLLAFSRKQVVQPVAVNLNEVVNGVASLLRRTLAADIELQLDLAPSLPFIEADRTQMDQILLNLALNARDAMPGGGQLVVSTRRERPLVPTEEGRVVLAVRDTGIGMDAGTRERIFEPFFTTKEPGKGTGLGLSTVYGLVEQSGGELRVRSEPGHGSTFEVLFPPMRPDSAVATPPHDAHRAAGGRETILLVEDDPAVRALAERVLARAGYTVLTAGDGRSAADLAQQRDRGIDLLLTDVVLPGIGGRELATQLTIALPGLPVLFTSGYTEDEVLRRGIESQAERFLAKPYTPSQLLEAVRGAIDIGGGTRTTMTDARREQQ